MKKFPFLKTVIATVMVLSTILIGCSKNSSTSALSSEVLSGTSKGNNGGQFQECPTFFQLGATRFHFDGKIVGLGNRKTATLTVESVVDVTHDCYNPGNGNWNGAHSGTVAKPVSKTYDVNNGKFDFVMETDEITQADFPGTFCPNGNWTFLITGVSLKSYVIKLDGEVLTDVIGNKTCTFSVN